MKKKTYYITSDNMRFMTLEEAQKHCRETAITWLMCGITSLTPDHEECKKARELAAAIVEAYARVGRASNSKLIHRCADLLQESIIGVDRRLWGGNTAHDWSLDGIPCIGGVCDP